MTFDALRARLAGFPRIPLTDYPTPLEHLSRMSKELGRDIYVKRDDVIGPGLGGNKTRKLEYLLAEAQEQKAEKVVTFGGLQSNHARITTAAARKIGLEPHLFFFEKRPPRFAGNLFVNRILNARMHFVPLGGGGGMSLETTIRLVRWLAWLRLGPHYFIPVGGHSPCGGLGYVNAGLEIEEQARSIGIENAWLILAAGTGSTLAGLIAGLSLAGSELKTLGIDVGKLWKDFPTSIARLTGKLCALLGEPRTFALGDINLVEETYVGEKYGIPSQDGIAALRRLAEFEGLLLDPVYTAKAFAGLLDLIQQGNLGSDEPIIFLHTGGTPGIFAIQDNLTNTVNP